MMPLFLDKQTMFFFCSLFDRSMLCSFLFHTHTFKRTGADLLSFFFLIDSVGYRYFYRFQTSILFLLFLLLLLLFISMFLFHFCRCLFFFSSAYFFPFSLYSVCVRVFKTMILFFRDRLFRKRRSRKRVSSTYLLRRIRASFEMFGC